MLVVGGDQSSYSPAPHFTDQKAEPWEVKGPAGRKLAAFICKMMGWEQIFSKALPSVIKLILILKP